MSKKIKVLFICAIIIIIALGSCVIVLLFKKNNPTSSQQDSVASRGIVATSDNIDDVLEQMKQAPVEPGYYTANMTNDWHFPSGDSPSKDAFVSNLPENTNDVYFDVVLEEDESHAIYKSPVIPLGHELRDIVLDEDLNKGVYNCILIYHLIDSNGDTVSTLRIKVIVTVES